MASETVTEITDQNFDSEVVNADKPVLVDFWAEWCMPCRMIAPTIDEIAEEYSDKIKVGKVDTDANRDTAMNYNINAIPTIILFHNGEVAKRFVGMTNKSEMTEAIEEVLQQS